MDEKKRRHIGPYELGRTLGEGAFGKVKLGTNIFTGEKVRLHSLPGAEGRARERGAWRRACCMAAWAAPSALPGAPQRP